MCLSFQFQKHLSLGRGGAILCDNKEDAIALKKMSYDGRLPEIPWRDQNIESYGYHYYMTPETAQLGLDKFDDAVKTKPKQWVISDWPDLTKMAIFNKKEEDKSVKIDKTNSLSKNELLKLASNNFEDHKYDNFLENTEKEIEANSQNDVLSCYKDVEDLRHLLLEEHIKVCDVLKSDRSEDSMVD